MDQSLVIRSGSPSVGNASIRASLPTDAEQLTSLCNLPGFRHGTMRMPFGRVADTRKWLESLGPNDVHLVASRDDRLVGSANLLMLGGRRRHAASIGMGVHDDHVGQGIGSALLAALLDSADNWLGLRRVELTVYSDNAPAIALYEKFGFEKEGTLRKWGLRCGVLTDVIAMARLR